MAPQFAKDTWIVIPAFNEAKNIGSVCQKLIDAGYKNIIAVNDCSTDRTRFIIRDLPVVDINLPINLGQGAALRAGTRYFLRKTRGKYLVHFDGDGQHRVEDIYRMVHPLVNDGYDATTGSRFLSKQGVKNIPSSKRTLLRAAVKVNYVLFGITATDAHNGFRAFTRKGARRVSFKEDRMEHASEIASLIVRRRVKHKEIPVIIDYNEYGQNFNNAIKIGINLLANKLLK